MQAGREQNYWPAFVDALSNVVLTLVFVLVIFVFALLLASSKVEQTMKEAEQEKAQSLDQPTKEQENQELKKQVAALTAQVEKLRDVASSNDQKKTGALDQQAISAQNEQKQVAVDIQTEDQKKQGTVQIGQASNTVMLNFPLSVAEIDAKSSDQLGHVLEAMQKSVGLHKVIIHSIVGKETYSVAKRLAYYRSINARNKLLKLGEAPENISISVVTPPQPEDAHVEIIFQKK